MSLQLSQESRWRRALLAHTISKSQYEIDAIIEQRYAWDAQHTKAAVTAFTSDDVNASTSLSAEFMEHLTKGSVVAQMLPAMMRVEFQRPFNDPVTAGAAAWVKEMRPIPVWSDAMTNHSLPRLKVGKITVFTEEALQQENAEFAVMAAQSRACEEAIDAQFLDVDQSGFAGESPASIAASADSVVATPDPAASVRALFKNFRNLDTTYAITDPETASQLSMATVGGANVFPDAGARGGSIGGVPLLTSDSSPRDSSGGQIVLLDASRVAVALGGVDVSSSREADIEMVDVIDSSGDGERASLFATNGVALRTVLYVNWALLDSGGCRVLTGADW